MPGKINAWPGEAAAFAGLFHGPDAGWTGLFTGHFYNP
jgi:hypothetical protein